MEITALNNKLIKETVKLQQKKYRCQSGKFLLEGAKVIKEAFEAGIKLETIFVEKSKKNEYNFAQNILTETTEAVLKKLSTTNTAPDIVAVGFQKKYDKKILKNAKRVVLLENIKDLGNLGTIIRTSAAFKADAVILYGQSADMYNPKCVRSSAGNLWKLPVITIEKFKELEEIFKNYKRIAALPKSNNFLKNFTTDFPCLIMFGSEANGLSDELIKFSTESVKIEMDKTVESLNLAVSVSIILYELFVK